MVLNRFPSSWPDLHVLKLIIDFERIFIIISVVSPLNLLLLEVINQSSEPMKSRDRGIFIDIRFIDKIYKVSTLFCLSAARCMEKKNDFAMFLSPQRNFYNAINLILTCSIVKNSNNITAFSHFSTSLMPVFNLFFIKFLFGFMVMLCVEFLIWSSLGFCYCLDRDFGRRRFAEKNDVFHFEWRKNVKEKYFLNSILMGRSRKMFYVPLTFRAGTVEFQDIFQVFF